ncbi:MAG: hypothetical protein PHJ00_00490 [Candidatus Omnitrophica bacterium]|nr:hypothetical protein [Candidatus Omnitrophota bacterium]
MPRYFSRIFLAVVLFLSLFAGYSIAAVDDGFGAARKIESRHFTIYYAPQLDPDELARSLDIRPSEKLISGGAYQNGLGGMIDILFAQACDILDMQLYSYHGTIKICRDTKQVNSIYRNLFDKDLPKSHSFYLYNTNTIYISAEHFKREVLGHEIGHAIISHYFVVSPSVKIQEVLAVFVEYQLRKSYQ